MVSSICFVGAGASVPFGVPTMAQMTQEFEQALPSTLSAPSKLYDGIKYVLRDYRIFDIEAMITVLQDIINIEDVPSRLFNHPSVHYFSTSAHRYDNMIELMVKIGSRHRDTARELLQNIKHHVGQACTPTHQVYEIYDELFRRVVNEAADFTPAASNGPPELGYTLYTTNYDQVLEDYCQSRKLAYEVGQSEDGLLDLSNHNTKLYSAGESWFQIFKLHGSVNWYQDQDNRISWLPHLAQTGSVSGSSERLAPGELLIHPANETYIFREPFYPMFHQLRSHLSTVERCYIVGYSFRDDNILGMFHDALEVNRSLGLHIVDPNAGSIVAKKFAACADRIQVEESSFSVEAVGNLISRSTG